MKGSVNPGRLCALCNRNSRIRMPNSAVQVAAVITALLIAVIAAVAGYRYWRRRRQLVAQLRQIESVAYETLRDVVLPDGNGGELHVAFLLLTARGLLVADLREVRGTIFGAETMDEWVVMDGVRRLTMSNPLEPLYDRIAAVKQLAGEVPVEGRVIFTGGGRFAKGRPPHVTMLESLSSEFPQADRAAGPAVSGLWRAAWEHISAVAVPSPLTQHR